MATDAQRARRRAQRETAQYVRESRAYKKTGKRPPSRLGKSITQPSREAQARYAYSVINGTEPYPAKRTKEGDQLARMASFASRGKADPAFYAAFQQYFYHDEKRANTDEIDEEYYEDEDAEDEE